MSEIKTDLPLGATQLHEDLQQNFEIIAKYFKTADPEKIGQTIKEYFSTYAQEHDDEIRREIRAIVLPEMSPLEVTNEVQDFKTDSKGVKHDTMSDRLMAELQYSQDEPGTSNEKSQ